MDTHRFITSALRIIISVAVRIISVIPWLLLARPVFSSRDRALDYRAALNPDDLRQHVATVTAEFFPRSHDHPDNLDRLATHIASTLRATGARVWEQVYPVNGIPYRNVIAEYGPENQPVVVVGAHYDAHGPEPAADDNASGVAGLLELGRLLTDQPLGRRVILAAYTLEEPPYFATEHMGSAVHANALAAAGTAVELMISLEMIGYFSDAPGSQDYPNQLMAWLYPPTGNFIAIVDEFFSMQARRMKKSMRRAIDLPVHSVNAPASVPGVDFSDHRNFWHHGYPAVMVTDTAFMRNQAYHTPEDTADRLDYEKMAQVVYGVYQHVLQLARKDRVDGRSGVR